MFNIDWRMIGVLFAIIIEVGTFILLILVKFNDLKHAEADIKELQKQKEIDREKREQDQKDFAQIVEKYKDETNEELKKICDEIKKIGESQIRRDAICDERHGRCE